MAGLDLDDWQQYVLVHALGEREDRRWAAPTVGIVCPRQNGKNAILEARELAGLFLFGERVILHSAHEQATASEQFRRLLSLIEEVPEFATRIDKVIKGKGSEGIELVTGQRILFKTRTSGGARGFTIDCLVFDEAYELPDAAVSAMVPTLSAAPNPQTWYASSAVDQEKHQHGIQLARQRERGLQGKPGIAYFEWSCPGNDPGAVPLERRQDREWWAKSNPAFGIRIDEETIQHECDGQMGPREFAVEREGVGDWPDTSEDSGRVISREMWAAAAEHDEQHRITGSHVFAIDSNPQQSRAAIAVCGRRDDGLFNVAVVDHRRDTDWVVDRCRELKAEFPRAVFVVDKRGLAQSHIDDLKAARLRVIEADASDYGRACIGFFAGVAEKRLRYPAPQPELDEALHAARAKTLGDAWKWSRRDSTSADISPLVAATLAYWGAERGRPRARVINLNEI